MDLSPLWISLKTALAATAICMVLGIYISWWRIRKTNRLLNWLDGLLLLPAALPPTVIGLALLFIFGIQSPTGQFLNSLGLKIVFTWPAAVIAATVVSFPLVYMTLKASFKQVDPSLLDAARMDGVSENSLLWKVLIPLARPGVTAAIILAFIRSIGEFGATLMIAGNIPGKTQTLPMAVYFNVEMGNTTIAWILAGISIAVSLLAIQVVTRMEK